MTTETTLQTQIEQALQQGGLSDVQVNVNNGQIFLSGSVPTGKEKHMAKQIAESNANGMRVIDKLTVTGRGHQK